MSRASNLSWLRIVRDLRGMSQRELAAASGVSQVAISKLENELRSPRWTTARVLADALGVPPEQLFPDDDQPSPADVLADYLKLDRSSRTS